jgi:hypothetical protein
MELLGLTYVIGLVCVLLATTSSIAVALVAGLACAALFGFAWVTK